jgi:hypothetical protein
MRLVLPALLLAVASMPATAFAKPVDLAFVNSVGGIRIGNAKRDDKGWAIPIEVNVSGLKTITTPPTLINSGLICERTSARVKGMTILITVHTGPARGQKSADCTAAPLGNIDPGDYDVFYDTGETKGITKISTASPEPLGRIHIMATSQILY